MLLKYFMTQVYHSPALKDKCKNRQVRNYKSLCRGLLIYQIGCRNISRKAARRWLHRVQTSWLFINDVWECPHGIRIFACGYSPTARPIRRLELRFTALSSLVRIARQAPLRNPWYQAESLQRLASSCAPLVRLSAPSPLSFRAMQAKPDYLTNSALANLIFMNDITTP